MKPTEKDPGLLWDIYDAGLDIAEFVDGININHSQKTSLCDLLSNVN